MTSSAATPFVVSIRTETSALLERFSECRDVAILAPYIQSMSGENPEAAFAIMRGSGNEMSPFL